jgi:hypothetical protein
MGNPIKHNIAKFNRYFGTIEALNEKNPSKEETLQSVLEIYKLNHKKNIKFCFNNCWLILCDVPIRWVDTREIETMKSPRSIINLQMSQNFK